MSRWRRHRQAANSRPEIRLGRTVDRPTERTSEGYREELIKRVQSFTSSQKYGFFDLSSSCAHRTGLPSTTKYTRPPTMKPVHSLLAVLLCLWCVSVRGQTETSPGPCRVLGGGGTAGYGPGGTGPTQEPGTPRGGQGQGGGGQSGGGHGGTTQSGTTTPAPLRARRNAVTSTLPICPTGTGNPSSGGNGNSGGRGSGSKARLSAPALFMFVFMTVLRML
ncbi:uncharacterized protein LOC144918429 [Branchiostoma floridae x Branchiostoma belcheri]